MFDWLTLGRLHNTDNGAVIENHNDVVVQTIHAKAPTTPLVQKLLYTPADPEQLRQDEEIARRVRNGGTIGSEVAEHLSIDTGCFAPVLPRSVVSERKPHDDAVAEHARRQEEAKRRRKVADAWNEVKDTEVLPRSVLALHAPAPQYSEAERQRIIRTGIRPSERTLWPVMRKAR